MAEFKTISYRDKNILHVDLVNGTVDDLKRIITELTPIVRTSPLKSVMMFMNIKGMDLDMSAADMTKKFASGNVPFMKKSAIVGAEGFKMVIFNSVLILTGRKNIKCFDNEEVAKNWLIED